MNFVQNILWNSVSGFVDAGTRTAGGYAGDALIKAGDMIESSGRSVGNSLERTASGCGAKISGQTYQSSQSLPPTARKAVKRSNSSPASSSAAKSEGPASKAAEGASKKVEGAQKQITGGAKGAVSRVGKGGGGAVGGAQRGIGGAQKAVGGAIGGAQKNFGGTGGSAQKTAGGALPNIPKSLPKPYPNSTPSSVKPAIGSKPNVQKPSPGPNSYPSEKKKAVKLGQPKPFNSPGKENGGNGGGETPKYPGAGNKTPVKPKAYKPLPGMAERGKVEHIQI
ncbi:hypothetical protein CC78DRAFT_612597 [Lojkania enalia]|uniref:Uncharacterized protein n=1 Tax=Lojkania enalia TaxID=147567 RepID=A0A9P4N9K2_9PLEO|nr:hypothetical protein CC78DRAFT_612597 [Didymosphaeria enalia]